LKKTEEKHAEEQNPKKIQKEKLKNSNRQIQKVTEWR